MGPEAVIDARAVASGWPGSRKKKKRAEALLVVNSAGDRT
jgi:hypothetical protein